MGKKVRRKKNSRDTGENPSVRFLYSEAVVKVLSKYTSCVNLVKQRYPSPYLYRDNTNLSLHNLPRLSDSYPGIPKIPVPVSRRMERQVNFPDLQNQDVSATNNNSRSRTFYRHPDLPVLTPRVDYHRRCRAPEPPRVTDSDSSYTFITERRSAYDSRRLPSALGSPLPCTYHNRPLLEKMWREKIPLCRD